MARSDVVGARGLGHLHGSPSAGRFVPEVRRRLTAPRSRLHGSEFTWAIAFVVPYAAVFIAFIAYPLAYGLWMASEMSLYADLLQNPFYLRTVVNTVIFVAVGVNVQMFLALLLSGFFMRRRWWIKPLLGFYILPWAISVIPAFISWHWMLIDDQGFLNSALRELFGIEGPLWLADRWLALGANIVSYIWKWMPFWTVVFLAARMAIPREILEAAEVDGATGSRRFLHVTLPLLANIYLICTMLSTVWTLGDFTTVSFVSGGGPVHASEVLATLAIRFAFDAANPALGVAATMSALPILIPVALILARRLQMRGVQL